MRYNSIIGNLQFLVYQKQIEDYILQFLHLRIAVTFMPEVGADMSSNPIAAIFTDIPQGWFKLMTFSLLFLTTKVCKHETFYWGKKVQYYLYILYCLSFFNWKENETQVYQLWGETTTTITNVPAEMGTILILKIRLWSWRLSF